MTVKPWLDEAGNFPISHIGGIPHFNQSVLLDSPRTGVLHTTEGGWASAMSVFTQHYAPQFLLGFDAGQQKVRIAQLVQVGTIGASLRAHNNQAIVQIEMVGNSKENPWLPDPQTAEALASLMAVCNIEYGIPLSRPWLDGDWGKYGNNPHRSSGKFGTVAGWFGHGDCPSPDEHWDPGNLQWSAIFAKAAQIVSQIGSPAPNMAGPAAMAASAMSAPKVKKAKKSKKAKKPK